MAAPGFGQPQPSEDSPLLGRRQPNGSEGDDDDDRHHSHIPASPRPRARAQLHPPPNRKSTILILASIFAGAIIISLVLKQITNEFRGDHPGPGTDHRGRLYPAVLAKGRNGAVAAENQVCSQIGVDALKDGGSAVDAAVAATLCTGVLNLFSSGIGGGGFMLVRDPAGCLSDKGGDVSAGSCANYTTIDFRETGPAAANTTMFEGRMDQARFGGLSVGVPGELRGLEEAHRRWGRLPWHRLVMPSVALAEESTVSRELARRLVLFGQFMLEDPVWAEVFVDPATGKLKVEGDTFRRTAYAETLRTIAKHGAGAFYTGAIAESLVETVQRRGGILTRADLAGYTALVKPALSTGWLDGRRIFTTPAPTSGPVLLSVLQVLARFPAYIAEGATGLNMHRFIEALKFGFAQRTELADPAFMSREGLQRIDEIPTEAEADRVFGKVTDDATHPLSYYGPKFDILEDHGTMHLSVVDADGGAVSLTSTVNLIFGSRVMDARTGVVLNDEMDDTSTPGVPNAFGLAPSPFNYPEAGKRPLSSTCPTMIENRDGSLDLVLGGSGGSRIFGSVAQVILHREWGPSSSSSAAAGSGGRGMDVSASIEQPRIHHQLLPAFVTAESGSETKTLNALRGRGHEVMEFDINMAAAEVQAVEVLGHGRWRTVQAASDSRKGGVAVAY